MGLGKVKTFHQAATRNEGVVIDVVSDKPIADFSTIDTGKVRDAMIAKGLAVLSVNRTFITIKAIINLAIAEHGIDMCNPFSAIFIPDADSKKRVSIPLETRRQIQQSCIEHNDDMRWLVALISDTGMSVAEAAGLHIDDLKLDKDIPYVNIKPHPWRPLKTRGSQRQVPLASASIWTAQRIIANASSCFAFPRFTDNHCCNANSASNALNKWLQTSFHKDIVVHGRLGC